MFQLVFFVVFIVVIEENEKFKLIYLLNIKYGQVFYKTTTRVFNTCRSFYIKKKKGHLYKADVQFFSKFNRILVIIILNLIKCMYINFRFSCNSVLPNGNNAKMCLVKIQKFPM